MGVLLSIHMTSNRPVEIVQFFDRLEAATTDPRSVEVVMKIDDTDSRMNEILSDEQKRRPFRITYISTPLAGGFFGLWKCYDELLKVADPEARFVVGLNDEMYFAEKGWDTRLAKYVDLHPDGIYRLRVSMHRERTTFDYWEASCAGELTPFMTRKWLDLSGGWCPCNGPDSFQNAVAFYFGWLYRHDTFNRPYREHVVHDIEFGAQGANLGLDDKGALMRRMRGAITAWFKLVSYPMQQEAARRAQILHAHIWAQKHQIAGYAVTDDRRDKAMVVVDDSSREVWRASYAISGTRIALTNFFRKFRYPYYGGMGEPARKLTPEQMQYYFIMMYDRTLQESPNIGYSSTGNAFRDSLPYRYVAAGTRILRTVLFKR